MREQRGIAHLKFVEGFARDVGIAWDRLARCEDEFLPEYPGACGEYMQALDEAILRLMRHADPVLWIRRQQDLRALTEIMLQEAARPATAGGEEDGDG